MTIPRVRGPGADRSFSLAGFGHMRAPTIAVARAVPSSMTSSHGHLNAPSRLSSIHLYYPNLSTYLHVLRRLRTPPRTYWSHQPTVEPLTVVGNKPMLVLQGSFPCNVFSVPSTLLPRLLLGEDYPLSTWKVIIDVLARHPFTWKYGSRM